MNDVVGVMVKFIPTSAIDSAMSMNQYGIVKFTYPERQQATSEK